MGRLISLPEAQALPKGQEKSWCYNALDCTGTLEIAQVLLPRLNEAQSLTYAFERALQAPAIAMMMRGVRVDETKRAEMVTTLKRELASEMRKIAKLPQVTEVWDGTELETGECPAELGKHHKWPRGVPDSPDRKCERCGAPRVRAKPFNPGSPDQNHRLFYELHGVSPIKNKLGEVSTDEDVLEKIGRRYAALKPVTDAILSVRNSKKQLGSLAAKLTSDGRYPSSFNVGAAWTGRFSSSKNPFQLGGNLQNVAERHRRVFIADPGYTLGYADYMQGESNIVAHLAGDPKYIEAHRVGDVHTFVCRYVFPDLPWTGDLKRDKIVAKVNPPWDTAPGHDYRFQTKSVVHGCNLGLTPFGIALQKHIPLAQAKAGFERYMTEFEYIPAWQSWVAGQVREHKPLVNPLGRTVQLFGRPNDKHTINQAYAFLPQSTLADIDDIAMWLVWLYLEPEDVQLLAQVHDALLHQFPSGRMDLEKQLVDFMSIPVPVTDFRGNTRVMTIGVETAVGKNWGHKNDGNPHGISEVHFD